MAWLFASALFYLVFIGWWFPWKKIFRKIKSLFSNDNNSETMFKGVPKPSSLLADLIAARVLQSRPEYVNSAPVGKTYVIGDVKVRNWASLTVIDSKGCVISFDLNEREKIRKACLKVDKIHCELRKSDAEAARQHRALDVIETFMKIGEAK